MSTIWTDFAGNGVNETFINAGGLRTRMLEAGSGRPLVLLHGTGGHAETYARNIGPLSEHFHVMALDMAGHGYTDRPDVTYTLDVFADHVIAVADAIGEDRIFLSGESLGGVVSCWTALKYPDRISGLKQLDDIETRTRRLSEDFSRETVRRRLEWLVLDPASVTDELVDIRYKIYSQPGMVDHMVELMCTVLQQNRASVGDVDYFSYSLSELKCPVLLIWTDHNPGKSLRAVQHVIDAIPQKEFHLLKDAAHWAQWEKPDEVNPLMIDFLSRIAP
jgi:2-hydroxy-6-oxonona-2,4-dienedioate hydrolase